jgi:hypothetical protein
VALQHGSVKRHDAAFMFRCESFIEMLVIWQFIHKGEQKTDPEGIPDVKQDVLVFFRLKERDGMDLEFAQRATVEIMQPAMNMPAKFVIDAGEELCDLLLCNGGRQVNIPDGETGKSFRIT